MSTTRVFFIKLDSLNFGAIILKFFKIILIKIFIFDYLFKPLAMKYFYIYYIYYVINNLIKINCNYIKRKYLNKI